jgi:hypothetical protein
MNPPQVNADPVEGDDRLLTTTVDLTHVAQGDGRSRGPFGRKTQSRVRHHVANPKIQLLDGNRQEAGLWVRLSDGFASYSGRRRPGQGRAMFSAWAGSGTWGADIGSTR